MLEKITPKILIVDDDVLIQEVIVEMLENHNFEICVASNINECFNKISISKPDLILMDINLHDFANGIELCKKIKEFPQTKDIPIIFLTGDASQIESSFKNGGVDFIVKPFSMAELSARIQNHLMINRQEKALRVINEFLEEEVNIKERQVFSLMNNTTEKVLAN